MEERDGCPYVSRSALKELLTKDGHAERTVRNMLNPSYADKMIGVLINAETIKPHEHGWIIIDEALSSSLRMRKNG